MSAAAQSFDFLTGAEAEAVQPMMTELADVRWAKPLLTDIEAAGGLKTENKAKLFELRFGHALHRAGAEPKYEVPGEGLSTIDFGFASGGTDFLVEMTRLEETDAARAATTTQTFEDGAVMMSRRLATKSDMPSQSPEGETLKAVERICQKLENGGKPHKFPKPGGKIHVVLVDLRNFMNGGRVWDRIHIALGGEYVPPEFRHYYAKRLVSGVFTDRTTQKGAAEARERLHFIGFVSEKSFEDGSFGQAIQFVANPNLFGTMEEARAALAGWPLGEPDILNERADAASARLLGIVERLSFLTVSESAELSEMLRAKWGMSIENG
jgi:hypothetical protein